MPHLDPDRKVQEFDWGTILWNVDPSKTEDGRLSVGTISFNPYAEQDFHVHAGYEQVLYVISGSGIQFVDDTESKIKSGDITHMPPYSRHRVINTSAEELKMLIVYTTSKFQVSVTDGRKIQTDEKINLKTFLDYEAIVSILKKLSEAIDMGLAIIDTNGDLIMATDNYPRFCSTLREKSSDNYCRGNLVKACNQIQFIDKPYFFQCCNGVMSVMIPICNGDNIIGYILCGQVFLDKRDAEEGNTNIQILADEFKIDAGELLNMYRSIKLEPKNRLQSAAEATFAVASCIADTFSAAFRQKELDSSKLSLVQEQMEKANLEKALREADLKLLQSQIHPHFLFNTLNTIAQMAYVEGAERAADLVWSLSDLLRSTLKRNEKMVPLQEEIKMLNSYLNIQLARFGDRLKIELDVPPGIEHFLVPSMLIQPLVENAIIHGFEGAITRGNIKISFRVEGNYVNCTIVDNGIGFDPETYNVSHRGCNSIGLSSVKNRLQYYFNDDYRFNVISKPNQGTTVELAFPQMGGNEHAADQIASGR